MDWAKHDHRAAPRSEPPAPELLEPSWRVVGPSNHVISCGIYRTSSTIEVRAIYDDVVDNLIRSTVVKDLESGRTLAAAWLEAVRETGGFTELPNTNGPVQTS